MKFATFLNEMPTLSKYTREAVKESVPTYEKYMSHDVKTIGKHDTYEFTKCEQVGYRYYALLDKKSEKIMFYSSINTYETSKHDRIVSKQHVLWKDKSISSETVMWAFNQILDDHKMIISDEYQSFGGKAFWKKLFQKFSNSNQYEVGHLDIIKKKLVPYTMGDDFDKEFEGFYDGMNEYTSLYIRKKD